MTRDRALADSESASFSRKPKRAALRLNAKKLLLSRGTAANPQHKETHFIVRKLIEPDMPAAHIEMIEIEATYSKRSFALPWCDLAAETTPSKPRLPDELWVQHAIAACKALRIGAVMPVRKSEQLHAETVAQ